MRLKSPASLLFTQPFIQAQIKENIKAPRHWLLCGNSPGPVHKIPVTRKMFPFDDVIMKWYSAWTMQRDDQTYWDLNKMTVVLQTTFSYIFSWHNVIGDISKTFSWKIVSAFWLKKYWNVIQMTLYEMSDKIIRLQNEETNTPRSLPWMQFSKTSLELGHGWAIK